MQCSDELRLALYIITDGSADLDYNSSYYHLCLEGIHKLPVIDWTIVSLVMRRIDTVPVSPSKTRAGNNWGSSGFLPG